MTANETHMCVKVHPAWGHGEWMARGRPPFPGRGRARVCGDCWQVLRPDEYEPEWSADDPAECSMCGSPMGGLHRVAWSEIDARPR